MVGNSQVRTNKHDSLSHLILSNCQSRACLVSQQLTSVAVLAMQACRQDCLRGMSSCCARALGAEAQPRVLTTSLQRKTVLIGKLEKCADRPCFFFEERVEGTYVSGYPTIPTTLQPHACICNHPPCRTSLWKCPSKSSVVQDKVQIRARGGVLGC